MHFVLYTNFISPHQLPLAHEMVNHFGEDDYRYIYTDELEAQRMNMGWKSDCSQAWCIRGNENSQDLLDCDILFSELRCLDVFAERISAGRLTCYVSERWFKPPRGAWRLLSPAYWKMACNIVGFLDSPYFFYFPQGIHAARDMMRLQGLIHGDLRCLFQAPKVAFEGTPGGRIIPLEQAIKDELLDEKQISWGHSHGFVRISSEKWKDVHEYPPWRNYRLWGYFVAAGENNKACFSDNHVKKVLWAGRMLDWKHVETLIEATPDTMELHLYGHGPEEENLKRRASEKQNIQFHDFVPIKQMRDLMQQHDVYVLPSDGGEGWGAVVNEALEEKMPVIATIESGAGATMLNEDSLFHACNIAQLRKKLNMPLCKNDIGAWTAKNAAAFLCDFAKKYIKDK